MLPPGIRAAGISPLKRVGPLLPSICLNGYLMHHRHTRHFVQRQNAFRRGKAKRAGWLAAVLLSGYGVLAVVPETALAQTIDLEQLQEQGLAGPSKGKWDVTLGLGIAAAPTYLGANDYRATPLPLASIRYGNLLFFGPGGIGINAINWHGLRAGPVIGFTGGRYDSSDHHLNGLGDIQPSLTAGGFVSYSTGPFRIVGTLRQAVIHEYNGLNGRIELDYRRALIPGKLLFGAGPEFDFANGQYAQTWFGVTPVQSAASGLPVFTPNGGMRDVGINANLTYRYSQHVFLRSFMDLRDLTGNIADSPIVENRTQWLIGFGAAYHF
jgi:MipA family protein